MNDISSIIAAINDYHSLNKREVATLLTDILRDTGGSLRPNVLFSHLREMETENELRSELAAEVLEKLNGTDFRDYSEYLADLNNKGINFTHLFNEGYPDSLWRLPDQPIALYKDGSCELAGPNIAIVGSRSATDGRINATNSISAELAGDGYRIVSGLAKGVDSAAHKGALSVDGETIAILPGDIESVYPKGNSDLADEIKESGSLVAEMSKFGSMHNGRYIQRNRITSGISDVLIVTASGRSGGTVRQAEIAKRQGIPRFLYTPNDGANQSPKELLKMGFEPFESASDLVSLLDNTADLFDTTVVKRRTLAEF